MDLEIESVTSMIEKEANKEQRTLLESQKAEIEKKRALLIKEAELLEDLNKFY